MLLNYQAIKQFEQKSKRKVVGRLNIKQFLLLNTRIHVKLMNIETDCLLSKLRKDYIFQVIVKATPS